MENSKYVIPDSVELLLDKSKAAGRMRDIAVKLPFFGFRHARKCAIDEYRFNRMFWRKVYEIYPALYGKPLTYDWETGTVHITNQQIHATEKAGA